MRKLGQRGGAQCVVQLQGNCADGGEVVQINGCIAGRLQRRELSRKGFRAWRMNKGGFCTAGQVSSGFGKLHEVFSMHLLMIQQGGHSSKYNVEKRSNSAFVE